MTTHENGKLTHKRGCHSGLDTILNLLINNTAITSNLRNISVAELLEKLQSDDFNETVKLLILGLAISQILNKFVDFEALLIKPNSSSITGDIMKDIFQKQKEAFINKYHLKSASVDRRRRERAPGRWIGWPRRFFFAHIASKKERAQHLLWPVMGICL